MPACSAYFLVQSTLLLLNLNVLFTIVVIALANDSTTINVNVLIYAKHSPTDNYYDDKAAVKTRKIQISEPNELNIAHEVANY